MPRSPHTPIAVVGVSALFPGSIDKDGFWRDILAGRDLLTDVPKSRWLIEDYYDADPKARDKTYARRGGFLGDIDFDPMEWGIPPSIVPATDTTQLLSLIVAKQVLEDACGSQFKEMPKDRVSVILGVTSAQELLGSMVSRLQRPVWVKALREMGLPEPQVVEAADRIASHYVEWQESTFPGVLGNVVAGRIANRFDLGGTNCVTDAACASSLSALAMAVGELRLGQSDLVITGGADTMNDIFMYVCFSKTPALSPTGDCRPFSDRADGTMLGEGIGMVALKRLADAERDGDRIYAVVKGVGSSSDGRAKSVYAPVPEGQASAMRRAYEQAGYSPDTVELIEAHGTGTQAGDAAEFEGLRQVFDETGRKDRQWCALGSVKSQVGHTKAAAGAAGLFKVVMALHHKVLPPTIKVDRPDPRLDVEHSPFYLNATPRPWLGDERHPRRASVSAFGFGGSNFHVALEEYQGPAPRPARVRPEGGELVLLSGDSAQAVAEQCRALVGDAGREGMLPFLARSTQEAFDASAPARLAVFAESEEDLARKLSLCVEQVAQGKDFSAPGGIDFAVGPSAGPVAFLFPGQGSQYLRMGADLAMGLEPARRAWERSMQVLLGAPQRLDEVVFPRAAFEDGAREAQVARLTATEWAQPAIAAMSLALLELLGELGVTPTAVAGHSFGEVTALCAAGALSRDDLLRVARKRGELMAEAARVPGAMTSVSARREDIEPMLAQWRAEVTVANHNSPNQLVLAGTVEAISEVEQRLGERGVGFSRLQVATAFHSPLVSPASVPFREFLSGIAFGPTHIDVLGTASAAPYPTTADAMRDTLAQQLAAPVRFVDQIEALYARGIRVFVEVGPGRVLTGLVGHILKQRPHRAIGLDRRGSLGFESLSQGLGQLSVAGVVVDYQRLSAGFAPVEDPRTRKKPAMALKLTGSSYEKPYPPAEGASALPKPNPLPTSPSTPLPSPVAQLDSNLSLAWIQAFQDSQRQTAEAHAAFQRAMTESHTAFLRSADQSLQGLAALLGQGPALPAAGVPAGGPLPAWQPVAPAPLPAAAQPMPPPSEGFTMPPAPAAPARAVAPASGTTPALSRTELESLLLGVVADKTGYPKEMIGLDMDLEADLGVDSIKRVQILAATMDRAPGIPEVGANKMAALRTLREIVAMLGAELGGISVAPATSPAAGASPSAAAPARATSPEPVATAVKTGVTRVATQRLAVEALEAPPQGLGTPGLFGPHPSIVTDDGEGVGAALVELLNAHGAHAKLAGKVADDAGARAVISLDGLAAVGSVADAVSANRAAFGVARGVARRFAAEGGTFITVQDTGGDFGLSGSERAWLGGPSALARTAKAEWPRAVVRALDVERAGRPAAAIAQAICDELLAGGLEREVGLKADGRRLTLATVSAALPEGAGVPVDSSSVIVASGGARGVTASCLIALAKIARCRFLLLGRTVLTQGELPAETGAALKSLLLTQARARGEQPTPAELGQRTDEIEAVRAIRRTMSEIAAAGGEARYVSVDISDKAAVKAALTQVRGSWGPVRGVVHGAGVLADKRIEEKTDAQWERVFRTKVLGLEALLEATKKDDLSLLLLFSSVAARWGNPGQCDYAMANEVLNKVAALEQKRRGAGCLVRALGWGPWNGGMVDAALKERFASAGVPMLDVEEGATRFTQELTVSSSKAEVLIFAGAEGAQASSASTEVVAQLHVDRGSYPFLDGHRVQGTAVVPVALCLEWFGRVAHALRPELTLVSCHDVQVLQGIKLQGFDHGGDTLTVRARATPDNRVELELLGADGTRHYCARGELAKSAPRREGATPVVAGLSPWSREIYDGRVLFHGVDFQVIGKVEGVSDAGLVAQVGGLKGRTWPGTWRFDAGLLDGGLQLALLWTLHRMGGAGLPTSIEAVHVYAPGPIPGSARCTLQGREVARERSVCDLLCVAPDGTAIAELRGIEVHLLPQSTGRAA